MCTCKKSGQYLARYKDARYKKKPKEMHGEARNGKREAKKDREGGSANKKRANSGKKGGRKERDVSRKCMRTSDG